MDEERRHSPSIQSPFSGGRKPNDPEYNGRFASHLLHMQAFLIQDFPDDRGVYICSAINEAATIQTDAELMIETFSPKAPSNLTATSSKDSITIRWTQNYIRADLKFSIWYRTFIS